MDFLNAIQHKGKIALLLLVVIFLELFCSSTYTTSITKIGESFKEAYSDRIIAQDYIYKMAGILHRKNLSNEHLQMKALLLAYEKTQLTAEERKVFGAFRNNMFVMMQLEYKIANKERKAMSEILKLNENEIQKKSLKQLDQLSLIQVNRMKDLNETSQKTVSFSSLLNQFDWALLIVIGLTIQVLIFSSNSTRPKKPQNQFLN
ncbi:MAG: hypothetical protein K0R26_309 [Bacteroidota bacterium]|jgi:hypothetical protein|nr:hypothetical protein [Bacteroidota bacterium]